MSSDGWDTYWQGSAAAALTAGGSSHPAVTGFWRDLFAELPAAPATLLDLASGNGAVVEIAHQVLGDVSAYTCADISAAALDSIATRFPGIETLVCDAAALPLADASFALVTSQFGIEYAAAGAVDHAVRVLQPGGTLVLMLHYRDGAIHRQCEASVAAMNIMAQQQFVRRARDLLHARFALAGGGDADSYQAAGRAFAPALRAVEDVMRQYGREVAHGTVVRLYRDVRTIHERIARYDQQEVDAWLDRMQVELDAYTGRMQAMCDAALDAAQLQQTSDRIVASGATIRSQDTLTAADNSLPLAWTVIADRSS